MNRVWLCVAALLFAGGCGGESGGETPDRIVTYFEGGSIILGDGSPIIENAAMIVDNGIVTAVGAMAEIPHPGGGAGRFDFTDHTIMPFLHNAHGHVGYVDGTDFSAANYSRENILEDLDRYLYWGVGTVASLGLDTGDIAFQIREEQQSGPLARARLLTAGRGITVTNGFPAEGVPAVEGVPYEVANAEEGRAAVRELLAQNVDFVKIWVDDNRRIVGQSIRFAQLSNDYATSRKLPEEIYRAIIDEAHAGDTRVVAHVRYLADAKSLVGAGIDALVHSIRDSEVDDALIEAMLANDVYYVPTLSNHQAQFVYADEPAWLRESTLRETVDQVVIATLSGSNYLAAKRADPNLPSQRREFDMAMQNVKALYDAGVRIGLGSDSGGEYYRLTGVFEHLELELMNDAGIPAEEVIRIGAEQTAGILGRTDSGTLAPGMRGDFLIVSGNPYEDVSRTRDIAEVFMEGEQLDRAMMSTRFQGFGN